MITCANKLCKWTWNYHGKRHYPAFTNCPQCQRKNKILKEDDPNYTDANGVLVNHGDSK